MSDDFGFNKLFSELVTNSHDNKLMTNKLIITFVTNYSQLPTDLRDEFFSKLETIWKSKSIRKTFISLCRMRAATSKMILEATGLPRGDVSDALNFLKKEGLALPAMKVKIYGSKGGPKPMIWGILGYDPEDITNAIETHSRMSTPAYAEADRITQLILDEYIPTLPEFQKDLSLREITTFIKRKCPGYDAFTVANIVAIKLSRRGIKIWR